MRRPGFVPFLLRSGLTCCCTGTMPAECTCRERVLARIFVALRVSAQFLFAPDDAESEDIFAPHTSSGSWVQGWTTEYRTRGKPDAYAHAGVEHWGLRVHGTPVLCERPLTALLLAMDTVQNLEAELRSFAPWAWLWAGRVDHLCELPAWTLRQWLRLRFTDVLHSIDSIARADDEEEDPGVGVRKLRRCVDAVLAMRTPNQEPIRVALPRPGARAAAEERDRVWASWPLCDLVTSPRALWALTRDHVDLAHDIRLCPAQLAAMRASAWGPVLCSVPPVRLPTVAGTGDGAYVDWTPLTATTSAGCLLPTVLAMRLVRASACSDHADAEVRRSHHHADRSRRVQVVERLHLCRRMRALCGHHDTAMLRCAFGYQSETPCPLSVDSIV